VELKDSGAGEGDQVDVLRRWIQNISGGTQLAGEVESREFTKAFPLRERRPYSTVPEKKPSVWKKESFLERGFGAKPEIKGTQTTEVG